MAGCTTTSFGEKSEIEMSSVDTDQWLRKEDALKALRSADPENNLLSAIQGKSGLDVSHPGITFKECQIISLVVQHPDNELTKLFLAQCYLAAESSDTIAEALMNPDNRLTHLDIEYNRFHAKGGRAIAEAIMHPNNKVTVLNFGSNELSREGGKAISEAIMHPNNRLTHLDLSNDYLYGEDAQVIAEALKHPNNKLIWLHLGSNGFSDIECGKAIASALMNPNTHLTELNLGYNNLAATFHPIAEALMHPCNKLTNLNLVGNRLDAEAGKALAEALKHANNKLGNLRMGDNNLGAAGGTAIAAAIMHSNNKLTALHVASNNLGAQGGTAIAESLMHLNNKITDFDISSNKLGAEGGQAMAEAIMHPNNKLTKLSVKSNDLDTKGVAVAEALKHVNNNVTDLDMSGNPGPNIGKAISEVLMHPNNKLMKLIPSLSRNEDYEVIAKASKHPLCCLDLEKRAGAQAAFSGDLNNLRSFTDQELDGHNEENQTGRNALFFAVRSPYSTVDAVRYLMEEKQFPFSPDVISVACTCSKPAVLQYLLDRAKMESPNPFTVPTMFHHFTTTWEFQRFDLAILLVQDDAFNLSYQDADGLTPLHWASKLGHLDLCEALVARGASLLARDFSAPPKLPLDCCSGRHVQCLEFLERRTRSAKMYRRRYDVQSAPPIMGGQHLVVFATDDQTKARVALKMMSNKAAFDKEVAALEALQPRNDFTPNLIEYFMDADFQASSVADVATNQIFSLCIVMEAGSTDLAQDMSHKDPNVLQTKSYAYSLAKALWFLSAKRLVHGDMKPANVALFDGQCRLIDYECATLLSEPLPWEATPAFVPPEMARLMLRHEDGQPVAPLLAVPSYDTWGFGLIVFELLTRRKLFELPPASAQGDSNKEQRRKLLERIANTSQAELESKLPGWNLKNEDMSFLKKCLQVDPLRRESMEVILEHAWFKGGLTATSVSQVRAELQTIEKQMHEGFAAVQETVMKASEAQLRALQEVHNCPIPKMFLLIPRGIFDEENATFWQRLSKRTRLYDKHTLHFCCEGDPGTPCSESKHAGFQLEFPSELLRKTVPVLRVVAIVLKMATIAARCYGIPLPSDIPGLDLQSAAKVNRLVAYFGTEILCAKSGAAVDAEVATMQANLSHPNNLSALQQQLTGNAPPPPTAALDEMYGELYSLLKTCKSFAEEPLPQARIGHLTRYARKNGATVWLCDKHAQEDKQLVATTFSARSQATARSFENTSIELTPLTAPVVSSGPAVMVGAPSDLLQHLQHLQQSVQQLQQSVDRQQELLQQQQLDQQAILKALQQLEAKQRPDAGSSSCGCNMF